MDTRLNLNSEEEKQMEIICEKVWKNEKNNGLRLVGVLTEKMTHEFK